MPFFVDGIVYSPLFHFIKNLAFLQFLSILALRRRLFPGWTGSIQSNHGRNR
jgi:hypothetical protein